MADNHYLVEFEESLSKFRDYPCNLTRTVDFSYTLAAYRSKLLDDEILYFDNRQPRIVIWDLVKPQDGKYASTSAVDMVQLRSILSETPIDPCRRFIFMKSASSRSPLQCTHEMMAYLFTHHQIMARFLDFTCAFRFRETPHSFTNFRNEDYLGSQHHQPGLSAMGRSGIRIQHCFNLLGVERGRGQKEFFLRQTAAYHSYDPVQGRALWVILKGDNTMRKRIESATEESARKGDVSLHRVDGSFAQTLTDHLCIMQWCVENWEAHAERLDAEYRDTTTVADHAPIDDMAKDIAILKRISLSRPTKPQGIVRKLKKRLITSFSAGTQLEPPPQVVDARHDLQQLNNFQSLSRLGKSLAEGTLAIAQNRRVLAQIKEYYRELVKSVGFRLHVPNKSTQKACKQAALEFAMKIGSLEDDLAHYESNLKTILHGIERTETMYNGILQYQGIRTARYFGESSERWTREMHEKTMSMHVITVFTLIFLPGTFTFFGSGIITFGDDGSGGFGSAMGAWKLRPAALKLFAAVCFPLLALTLLVWVFSYYSKRNPRNRNEDKAPPLRDQGDLV